MNHIFYHLYYFNDAVERFAKTLAKIKQSGLYDNVDKLYLNVVNIPLERATDLLNLIDGDPKIQTYNINNDPGNEAHTLELLWDTCQNLDDKDNVLYLHSKGVTRVYDADEKRNVQSWIDFMEYFLIEKWQDAIEKLKDHDACGVNLIRKEDGHQHPHFSGNFWWASNLHVKKTTRFSNCNRTELNNRMYCEFWLLDWGHVPNNNPYCLHNSKMCLYKNYYDPINYRK